MMNEEPGTILGDFMSDFRHLCDAEGMDFDEMLRKGMMHYTDEIRGVL